MWFKNLQIYRLPKAWESDADTIAAQLAQRVLPQCGALDAESRGWVAPCDGGALVHAVNRQWLLALGIEEKLLPGSVVKQFAKDKAKVIEETQGRRVGRKEMREIVERTIEELLPRAFVRRRTTYGWIDPQNGWLVIDAASPAKAEEFLEQLRKAVDGLPVKALQPARAPASAMTGWVAANEAPTGFTLDQDLELRSIEDATVRYSKHALEGEEIRQHVADGKSATKLGMTWNDRVSFVLTDTCQVKRVTFLDILREEAENQSANDAERFDLDFTLMAGELARLLDDLIAALGGEAE